MFWVLDFECRVLGLDLCLRFGLRVHNLELVLRVQGLGIGDQSLGIWQLGLNLRFSLIIIGIYNEGVALRVWGLGFWGLSFQGLGHMV